MWPWVIGAVALVGTGFGTAWQIQELTITKIKLEASNELTASQEAARIASEEQTARVLKAQNKATASGIKLRSNVASAVSAGNGLRIQTASAVHTAASDPTLCSDTAATLGELLTTVTAERRELAEAADRHVIDIQALMDREGK